MYFILDMVAKKLYSILSSSLELVAPLDYSIYRRIMVHCVFKVILRNFLWIIKKFLLYLEMGQFIVGCGLYKGDFMKLKSVTKHSRPVSLILAGILMLGSLSGCGSDKNGTGKKGKKDQSTEIATPIEAEQVDPYPNGVDVSLIMVGDLLMHERVQLSGELSDGTYSYDHMFEHVKDDVQAADCAIINNEVIYGGNDLGIQGYPNFSARDEVADAVANAGFDVVLHASNHTMDWGVKAIEHCMSYWESAHPEVEVLGIHPTPADASEIYIYEKGGFKIAMLNYTYGLNGFILPDEDHYMIDMLDDDNKNKIAYDIRRAKDMADAVVVFPHWGTEYNLGVDDFQKDWAQFFADEGVTLVLGDHPHVVEPVEWITGKNGNQMLCYYSMGNFISTQETAEPMLGLMAKVTLHKDKSGAVSIASYAVEPLVTHRVVAEKAMTTYRLRDYTPALAAENSITEYDDRWSIEFMEDLCTQVFGDLYTDLPM